MKEDKRISIGLITQIIFDAATNLSYDMKDKHEIADSLYDLINMIDEYGIKTDSIKVSIKV